MKAVEYKLHRTNEGAMITPPFISDGGYFENGNKFIGAMDDTEKYYTPETNKDNPNSDLVEYSKTELITHMQSVGIKGTNEGMESALTSEEIATLVGNWCDERYID